MKSVVCPNRVKVADEENGQLNTENIHNYKILDWLHVSPCITVICTLGITLFIFGVFKRIDYLFIVVSFRWFNLTTVYGVGISNS